MHHAHLYVDNLHEFPLAIDVTVRGILGLESWNEPTQTHGAGPFAALATTFLAESQLNARDCLLEGDWKASLYCLVRSLAMGDHTRGTLRTQMSEKV